jgi:hypothetical protein
MLAILNKPLGEARESLRMRLPMARETERLKVAGLIELVATKTRRSLVVDMATPTDGNLTRLATVTRRFEYRVADSLGWSNELLGCLPGDTENTANAPVGQSGETQAQRLSAS